MPRIPDSQTFRRRAPGQAPARPSALGLIGPVADAANIQGEGLKDFAGSLGRTGAILEQKVLEDDALQLSMARAELNLADSQNQQSFTGDSNHSTFIERYDKQLANDAKQIGSKLPGRLKKQWELLVAETSSRGKATMQKLARAEFEDQSRATLLRQKDELLEAAIRNPDPAAAAEGLDRLNDLFRTAADGNIISDAQAEVFRQDASQAYAISKVETISSPGKRLRFLLAGSSVDEKTGQRTRTKNNTVVDLIPTDTWQRMIRQAEREVDAKVRSFNKAIADMVAVLEQGRRPIGLEDMKADLGDFGTQTSNEALAVLERAEADGAALIDFTQSSLLEQREQLSEFLRRETVSREDLELNDRRQRAHRDIVKGLAVDPINTAAAYGVIDRPVKLDFQNVQTLRNRAVQADMISEAYGVSVTPLSKAEAQGLETLLDQATPQQAAAVLGTLVEGFGEEGTDRIAGLFAAKRPGLSVAIFQASRDPLLSADIVDGMRILTENEDLKPEPLEIEEAMGNVYGNLFEYTPSLRAPLKEAATALYAKRTVGDPDPDVQDAVEQALRDVATGPFELRRRTILPPNSDVGEDEMEDLLESISDADLERYGNGVPVDNTGRRISAQDIRDDAAFVTLSPGRYMLEIGDGIIGRDNAVPGQSAFVIDIKRMIKERGSPTPSEQPRIFAPRVGPVFGAGSP